MKQDIQFFIFMKFYFLLENPLKENRVQKENGEQEKGGYKKKGREMRVWEQNRNAHMLY